MRSDLIEELETAPVGLAPWLEAVEALERSTVERLALETIERLLSGLRDGRFKARVARGRKAIREVLTALRAGQNGEDVARCFAATVWDNGDVDYRLTRAVESAARCFIPFALVSGTTLAHWRHFLKLAFFWERCFEPSEQTEQVQRAALIAAIQAQHA